MSLFVASYIWMIPTQSVRIYLLKNIYLWKSMQSHSSTHYQVLLLLYLFIYLLHSVFISLFCIQNYLKSPVYAHRYS